MASKGSIELMPPVNHRANINGLALSWWEWRGDPANGEAPLFFAHATGFHARIFDAVIEHFPGRRVISADLRGHGLSEGEPVDDWRTVIGDVAALLHRLELHGAVGIGHSMGGHMLAQCAADMQHVFSDLILFDPVILTPEYYADEAPLFTPDNPHPSIRRKREFPSVEAMMERFGSRDPYALFDRRVFADYCRYGLVENPVGDGMVLACSPQMEASIYGSSRSNSGIHEAVKRISVPTLVVRAKQTGLNNFKGSPTWPLLAQQIPKGTDLPRPDRTHFHPFEDPADAAAIIKGAIAR